MMVVMTVALMVDWKAASMVAETAVTMVDLMVALWAD